MKVREGSCDEGGAETPVFFQLFGFYYQIHGSEFHQQADAGSGSGSEVSVDVSLPVKWQEDGQAVCHVVFEFNNEEIVEHCPVETWHSGKHILSLYYPIEKIVANYTNTFNVYLWMENSSGTVDVGDCIASVSGQAMAAGEA